MYDQTDDRGIPVSTGIPPIIYISAIVGLFMIATVVTLVFRNSSANHSWPASTTMTIPLK